MKSILLLLLFVLSATAQTSAPSTHKPTRKRTITPQPTAAVAATTPKPTKAPVVATTPKPTKAPTTVASTPTHRPTRTPRVPSVSTPAPAVNTTPKPHKNRSTPVPTHSDGNISHDVHTDKKDINTASSSDAAPSSASSSSSSGLSSGAKAGISIAVILGTVLAVAGVMFWVKKTRTAVPRTADNVGVLEADGSSTLQKADDTNTELVKDAADDEEVPATSRIIL